MRNRYYQLGRKAARRHRILRVQYYHGREPASARFTYRGTDSLKMIAVFLMSQFAIRYPIHREAICRVFGKNVLRDYSGISPLIAVSFSIDVF